MAGRFELDGGHLRGVGADRRAGASAGAAFGATPLVVSALSAIVILLLLRIAVQRQEAERQRQEAQLAQAQHEATLSHQRFAAAFSHAAIGMVIVKPDGTMLQANDALCAC
jgi:PAS domain-containing protein